MAHNKFRPAVTAVAILLIAGMLCCLLTACGEDYSKHEIDYFATKGGFSWDMTKGEAGSFVFKMGGGKTEETERETYYVVQNDKCVVRFDKNERVDMVKMINDGATYEHLSRKFGKEDKHEKSEFNEAYIWYGMMDGEKTKVTFIESWSRKADDDGKIWGYNRDTYLSFERKK